jgi:branched-chain amino acid transport system permease protein
MTTAIPAYRRPVLIGVAVLTGILLLCYPLVLTSSFAQDIGISALTMAIAATGWNVLGGYTGQVSFGHAVFFAAGMYGTVTLVRAGWSPWLAMPPSALIAAVIAVAIGLPCFRLRRHYFSIATIAVAEVALTVVTNTSPLGGADGRSVPLNSYGLWNLQFALRDKAPYYYVALALFVLATGVAMLFLRGRAGRYCQAIRDDDAAAAAAGVPVRRYKLLAAAISAALTSVAGSFQVMVTLYADPTTALGRDVSTLIALIAIIGGAGSLWGPLLGAWVVISLQQVTSTYLSVAGRSSDLMLYGLLIIVVIVVEPKGLVALIRRAANRIARRTGGAAG